MNLGVGFGVRLGLMAYGQNNLGLDAETALRIAMETTPDSRPVHESLDDLIEEYRNRVEARE